MVKVFINNGYIISIMHGADVGNISDAEYQTIMDKVNRKPTPPDGYDYHLTVDLEWEMFELPKETDEPENDKATKATLAEPGVRTE